MKALLHTEVTQVQRKVWHDKNIINKLFQEGDLALMCDSRFKDFKGKLMNRWFNPYVIEKFHGNKVVQIRTIDEEGTPLLVNGYRLKAYKIPLSREEFINTVSKEVNVLGSVSTSDSQNS